jgi:hypothetical protein
MSQRILHVGLLALGAATAACSSSSSTDSLVDCSQSANSADPKCNDDQAGTVGKGPKFEGGLTTQVNHGFITGNQLVVAVEFGGEDDEYGGVFGIDLTTGDRTLLAGKYMDPVMGEVSKGTPAPGMSLNEVRDVALGPNNTWYALVNQSLLSNRTIFSIDPATGNQKVVYDQFNAPCMGLSNGAQVALDPDSGFTVGPDGSLYVALNNNPESSGKGIAKLTANGACSIVTLSAAATASDDKGTGPEVTGSLLYNVTYNNNAIDVLQFNTHSSVISIDPATGNRTMVSLAPDKGTGPELLGGSMAIAKDGTIWTYDGYDGTSEFVFVSANPSTGNRTGVKVTAGPAAREQGTDKGIWAHPDGTHILVQYANAILIVDPATGNSNTLSY